MNNELTTKLQQWLTEYQALVNDLELKGIDKLSYAETEDYGYFKGKVDMIETMLLEL